MWIISIISYCVFCHLSHPSSLSSPSIPLHSAGQWDCCSRLRAYEGLRLEHFVLSLPASHVPPLSKPGQCTISPGPAHVNTWYFWNPFWLQWQHEQALYMLRHFQGVGLALQTCMPPRTVVNILTPSSRSDVFLFHFTWILQSSVHFEQRYQGLSECWSCSPK